MAKTTTLIANMTIETGTPKKPVSVQKDESFECSSDEEQGLLDRGIARRPVEGEDGQSTQAALV